MPAPRAIARHEGREVREATLETAQAQVRVLNWGCALSDWRVAVGGEARPVVLGFPDFAPYRDDRASFGAVVGRVANRIAGARFRLGGAEHRLEANDPPHCLHGGSRGLGRRLWEMEADAAAEAVRLSCVSPDGEGGFPGRVAFEVVIRLEGARLVWEMRAAPDRPTPIALAQHVYWNLDGADGRADVGGHRLRLAASRFTPVDAGSIPTGELREVAGGPLDFRAARPLRGADGRVQPIDVNFALDPDRAPAAPAAEVTGGRGDLRLRLRTDQPGLQVYDAPGLDCPAAGWAGARYGPFAGLCLEAQNFPDAVNRPDFPDPVFGPDRPYLQRTEVEIAPP